MLEDSKYIIVPNDTDLYLASAGRQEDQPDHTGNENARYLEKLVIDGYRIISKLSTRLAIHYVLIKFKPDTNPTRRAGVQTPTVEDKPKDVAEDGAGAEPLDLDDIPF